MLGRTQTAVRELPGIFDSLGNTRSSLPPACSEVVVMSANKNEDVIFTKRNESKNADQTLMFISLLTSIK